MKQSKKKEKNSPNTKVTKNKKLKPNISQNTFLKNIPEGIKID